jgi:hypothetical protein
MTIEKTRSRSKKTKSCVEPKMHAKKSNFKIQCAYKKSLFSSFTYIISRVFKLIKNVQCRPCPIPGDTFFLYARLVENGYIEANQETISTIDRSLYVSILPIAHLHCTVLYRLTFLMLEIKKMRLVYSFLFLRSHWKCL